MVEVLGVQARLAGRMQKKGKQMQRVAPTAIFRKARTCGARLRAEEFWAVAVCVVRLSWRVVMIEKALWV
jgi:hypothetical protein